MERVCGWMMAAAWRVRARAYLQHLNKSGGDFGIDPMAEEVEADEAHIRMEAFREVH